MSKAHPRLFGTFLWFTCLIIPCLFTLTVNAQTDAAKNPTFFYLDNGQLVGSWGLMLGDPSDWALGIQNREGKSKSGKLSLTPSDFKGKGDAIQATWDARKKDVATLSIVGPTIDLSAFKDVAALTMDIKVDKRPSKAVSLSMSCTWPCRGEVQIRKLLTEFPVGEWFSLPVPLNCFKGEEEFDLSKISGPFTLGTEGKLDISITNIRLERMAEGDKGCAD